VDNKAKAGNAVDSQQANQPDSQAKVANKVKVVSAVVNRRVNLQVNLPDYPAKVANKVKVVSAVDNRRVSQSCSPVKVVSREFLRILGRNQ
jgi:hypothetical protein